MPHAELTIHVPRRVWFGDLSRQFEDTTFRILSAFPDEDGGSALAEIESPDIDAVLSTMAEFEEVTALELMGRSDSEAVVQFDTSDPVLLLPLRESGTLLDLPFEVRGGEASWEVTATHDRLSTLGDQLRGLGIDFDVESIARGIETDRLLTDRQLRLVEAAVEAGYYDTPRECTLTELAEEVDVAKSTASETLHRAEERIIKEFVADAEP